MFISTTWKNKLAQMPAWSVSVYAAICSFCVYFCMYAFRKPFTAAGFEGQYFLHIDYKIWLVSAQVMGYMLSKFYGIRFIAGMQLQKRADTIIILIIAAWMALLLFALTPSPYNIILLLLNGFPLGMIWGLVFSYVEGRKTTEFMGAVLSVSFSFSSGVVKTIGKGLIINAHISEFWMPFATGSIFLLPLFLFTWLLNHTPPPTQKDIEMRSVRNPMTKQERRQFIRFFLPGIIIIVTTYVLLTILRDFRDNFSNELYTELGYGNNAAIFTVTETPVSLMVLLCMSLLILVKNNVRAFLLNHAIIIGGNVITLIATLLFIYKFINPVWWMILVGTGLYISYVPFNALYFERMIATYRMRSNVGFLIYISDAFGYLGSMLLLFLKEFIGLQLSWTAFFINAIFTVTIIGILGTSIAAVYFKKKHATLFGTSPQSSNLNTHAA
ncbi:DUF5690 family protein [Parafilimonas sp.]|uniref:DUF5690 family protein n=1 Tax=Parafilimonas sp. TaxID=1969739 RepID=UPI0039E55A8E